jgi:SAM-dependent methyltransferase
MKIEELNIDPRKWRLFLPTSEIRQLPTGYTLQGIWDYRLWEAREHFKYFNYQERFPPGEYPRLLMLGAGTGAEIKAAQEYGYKAVGIGLLPEEQVNFALAQGVDFRLMDMHDLKFPNESFDVVYCSHSFEHCANPWLVCVEVWATLRPYGRWWINLPTWQSSDKDGPSNQHFSVLPPWFMRPMFKRSGFKELYFEDNEINYQYLLEKLPLNEINVEQASDRAKSLISQLSTRLQIGKEYERT